MSRILVLGVTTRPLQRIWADAEEKLRKGDRRFVHWSASPDQPATSQLDDFMDKLAAADTVVADVTKPDLDTALVVGAAAGAGKELECFALQNEEVAATFTTDVVQRLVYKDTHGLERKLEHVLDSAWAREVDGPDGKAGWAVLGPTTTPAPEVVPFVEGIILDQQLDLVPVRRSVADNINGSRSRAITGAARKARHVVAILTNEGGEPSDEELSIAYDLGVTLGTAGHKSNWKSFLLLRRKAVGPDLLNRDDGNWQFRYDTASDLLGTCASRLDGIVESERRASIPRRAAPSRKEQWRLFAACKRIDPGGAMADQVHELFAGVRESPWRPPPDVDAWTALFEHASATNQVSRLNDAVVTFLERAGEGPR